MRCLIVVFSMFFFSFPAAAMVVSDPTSYTYYIEQVTNLQKQVEIMQKTVNTMEDIQNTIETGDIAAVGKVQRQLEGTYRRATNAGREIDETAKRLGATTGPLEEPSPNADSMQWAGHNYLQSNFKAPGEVGKTQVNRVGQAKARDYTYEQALLASNQSLLALEGRFDLQKDLADQIDKTENIKDAQDLSNRILLELVTIQTEMLAAINYMSAAIAAREYQGLSNKKSRPTKNKGNFDAALDDAIGGNVPEWEDMYRNESSKW